MFRYGVRFAGISAFVVFCAAHAIGSPETFKVAGTTRATWYARDGTIKESETGSFLLIMSSGFLRIEVVDPHGTNPRHMIVASNWKEMYSSVSLIAEGREGRLARAFIQDELVPSGRIRWEVIQRLALLANLLHDPEATTDGHAVKPAVIPDYLKSVPEKLGNKDLTMTSEVSFAGEKLQSICFWLESRAVSLEERSGVQKAIYSRVDVVRYDNLTPCEILYTGFGSYIKDSQLVAFPAYTLRYEGHPESIKAEEAAALVRVGDKPALVTDNRFSNPQRFKMLPGAAIPFTGTSMFEVLKRRAAAAAKDSDDNSLRVGVLWLATVLVGFALFRMVRNSRLVNKITTVGNENNKQ